MYCMESRPPVMGTPPTLELDVGYDYQEMDPPALDGE